MNATRKLLARFQRTQGQGMAEYAFILALVAVVAVVALGSLGTAILAMLNSAASAF